MSLSDDKDLLVKKNSKSHALELQLRSCEYNALLDAMNGVTVTRETGDDVFGANDRSGVSNGVIAAAKEALGRMPVVDLSVLNKQRYSDNGVQDDDDIVGGLEVKSSSLSTKKNDDLLDLEDIFGGAAQPSAATTSQNGITANASAAASAKATDMDLLSDIFSTPDPVVETVSVTNNVNGGSYDPFVDISSAQPQQHNASVDAFAPNRALEPVAMSEGTTIFDDAFVSPPQGNNSVVVQGPTHCGLAIDFDCAKFDSANKSKSSLTATFKNTNTSPIHGLSLQVAVPKYVKMELKPPTSTTIAPAGGNNNPPVTQSITVTNEKLGQKNLMLKLKLSFTLNGSKVEHMATVSGFPSGEF